VRLCGTSLNLKAFSVVTVFLLSGISTVAFASREEASRVREAIHTKNAHWKAAENPISELPEQMRKQRLGVLRNKTTDDALVGAGVTGTTTGTTAFTSAPSALDWRNQAGVNYVSPIRDQGNCGSCWAFAATAALESQVMLSQGLATDLSEQVMVSCSGAGSCGGGSPTGAANYLVSTGLPPESYDPYTATDLSCSSALSGWQNVTQKVWGIRSIPMTVTDIENAVATYGPVTTTMAVYNDFYYYAGGVYQYTSGAYAGDHAITIVGYDHANQYFIVKNSWGGWWGEGGYFRIAYSQMTNSIRFGSGTLAYYSSTAQPSIALNSPVGGEDFIVGSMMSVRWSYQGSPGSTVNVVLLKSGSPVATIASGASVGSNGAGSVSWKIPATIAAGNDYRVSVTSTSNGSYSSSSAGMFTISPPPAAPNAPTGLAATLKTVSTKRGKKITTTTSVSLVWTASSSTAGIASYSIFRNGTKIGSSASTSYSDSGTSAGGGTYSYTVQAVDTLGQSSPMSSSSSVSR
jgi:C1A family cysteine protease